MRKDFRDFINAVNNVIFGKEADFSGIRLDKMYALAKAHGMSNILFEFVKKNYGTNSDEYAEYEKQNDLQNYKYIFLDKEYNAFKKAMNTANVRYIPLKGAVVRELYPSPELREMSDMDIFAEDLNEVRKYLTGRGFEFEVKGHHDVYKKTPGLCFEIHRTLVDKQRDTGFDEYLKDPWKYAVCISGGEYRLTAENEYIYLAAHLYGHFHQGGTGIRTVLDLYLYKEKNKLDFEYINSVLEKCGIAEFTANIQDLAECWFGGGEETPLSDELGEYVITSGAYGKIGRLNMDLSKQNSTKTEHIKKTVKRKLFLNRNEILKRYPWAKRRLLLPSAYAVRIIDVIVNHNKELRHWVGELGKSDKNKLREHKERMKRFGVK